MPIEISSHHPEYVAMSPDWTLMRDAHKGERQVKSKRTAYLPATDGQIALGMNNPTDRGFKSYLAYLTRARFPNYVKEAVSTAVGMMHSEPPEISLPAGMEGIRSAKGESMPQLLRRINEEQLITGRIGLLADLPVRGGTIPYIATYSAERIINWDNGTVQGLVPQVLNLVVLDETEHVRSSTGFDWDLETKYRVLQIGGLEENEPSGIYRVGIFSEDETGGYDPSQMRAPGIQGRTLDKIPMVIINSTDHVPEPQDPALLDLGNLCMTIYRGEADYRQNLFMQGQDTLVVIGGAHDEDDDLRTGAGARIDISNPQGDAKFIGVNSDGLSEQREALKEDRARASSMGAQTADTVSRERESGKSLGIRLSSRTADLNTIADVGAAGLENILKIAAEWMGLNPEEVSVIPNKEFGETELTGQTMVEQQTARNLGFPISARSLHKRARDKGLTDMSFEEETAAIAEEEKNPVLKRDPSGDRNGDQKNKTGNPANPDETN